MNVSSKIADIKPGRVVELPEVVPAEGVKGRKATAYLVVDVARFRSFATVTGVKLDRSGKAHRSGKLHTVNIAAGEFWISWNTNAAAPAYPDNVQHADGNEHGDN